MFTCHVSRAILTSLFTSNSTTIHDASLIASLFLYSFIFLFFIFSLLLSSLFFTPRLRRCLGDGALSFFFVSLLVPAFCAKLVRGGWGRNEQDKKASIILQNERRTWVPPSSPASKQGDEEKGGGVWTRCSVILHETRWMCGVLIDGWPTYRDTRTIYT